MTILGETKDDAAGEAFDKVAKLMACRTLRACARPHGSRRWLGLCIHQTQCARVGMSFSGLKTQICVSAAARSVIRPSLKPAK